MPESAALADKELHEDKAGAIQHESAADEAQEDEPQLLPPPVFQPPSLLDSAIKALGRRLEVMTSRQYRGMVIPLELYLRVLHSCPSAALTADRLRRIEANMPCLVNERTDDFFWRPFVARQVHGAVSMPYPVLVQKALDHKKLLEGWASGPGQNPKLQVPEEVLSTLHQLKQLPVSARFLKDTMLAAAVSAVAKLTHHNKPASLAKELKASWKQLVTTASPSNSQEGGGGKVDPLSPVAIGERATTIKTWKDVYEFSLEYDALKRAAFAKRARAMREEEDSKRQKIKDVKEAQASHEKRPAAGNTDRVKKLVGMKPAIGHKLPKGPGGIKFISSKDKKAKR